MKKVEIELPEIEGFSWDEEKLKAALNKKMLEWAEFKATTDVLRKIEPVQKWRDAEMPRDFGKLCRSKEDSKDEKWLDLEHTIRGQDTDGRFLVGAVMTFQKRFCQVLDESEGEEEFCEGVDLCEHFNVCGECDACSNSEEPQTLQQRIVEQFPDKRVEVLERTATALKIDTGSSMMYHIVAPSLKGFAGFVYEHDKGVFTENLNACVKGYKEDKARFPVAVLFEADK